MSFSIWLKSVLKSVRARPGFDGRRRVLRLVPLEQRRVLNADVALIGSLLSLDNLDGADFQDATGVESDTFHSNGADSQGDLHFSLTPENTWAVNDAGTTSGTSLLSVPATADPVANSEASDLVESHSNSADLSDLDIDGALGQTIDFDTNSAEPTHEIIFVDSQVDDYQSLIEGVSDDAEIVVLNGDSAGIEQIADYLAVRDDVDAIHIVSHGSSGELHLGSSSLTNENLDSYADEFAAIRNSLSDDADILFYGCDVADGDRGTEFVESLARITDADVAASTDRTGSAELGGDWDFETVIGTVTTESAISLSAQTNYSHVLVAPVVTDVTVDDTLITDADDGGTLTVTVTFDQAMLADGTANPNLTFSPDVAGGGTLINPSVGMWSVGDTVFTQTFEMDDVNVAVADVTIDVEGGVNLLAEAQVDYAPQIELSVDTLNPTVISVTTSPTTITDSDVGVGTFTITVDFSEDMTDDGSADPTLTFPVENPNATITFASGSWTDADTYVATYDVADANVTLADVDVNIAGATDAAGNILTASTATDTFNISTANPTVIVDIVDASLNDPDNTSVVNFTFSEATTDFDNTDVTVVGGTLSAIAGAGTNYTATFTATDGIDVSGSVTVNANSYTNIGGNPGSTGTDSVVIDTMNPTVTVDIVDAMLNDPDNTSVVNFTFSEATTDFDNTDVTVVGGTLSAIAGAGTNYTATFTATDGIDLPGSVTVNANSYTDAAGNLGATGDDTVTIDTQNPTVTVDIVDLALNDGDNMSVVNFTFTEITTDFDNADVTVVGGTLSAIVGVGTNYTATFTATDGVDVTGSVTVNANSYTDAAGNLGATGVDTVAIDTLNPTVLSIIRADDDFTNAPTVDFTVTFSEDVTGVDLTDFGLTTTVTGAAINSVTMVSADVYTVTVNTGTSDGTINVDLAVAPTINDVNTNALLDTTVAGVDDTYTIATTEVLLTAGELTVNDIRDATADGLTVSIVGGNLLQVDSAGSPIAIGAGVTRIDADTVQILLTDITAGINITTGALDDTINIEGADNGLTIDGEAGNDIVNFQTTATATLGGDVLVTAETATITAGLTTAGGDVKFDIVNNLDINAAVDAGTGDLFLAVSAGNVNQTASVSGAGLGLMVSGTTTLQTLTNDFDTIAADNGGEISYVDVDDLTIGSVTVDGMTVDDVVATGSDISITAGSILDGDTLPDTADFDVDGANVTLTATTGSIGSVGTDIFKDTFNALEVRATGNLAAEAMLGVVAIDATVTGITTIDAIGAVIESAVDLDVSAIAFTVTNLALLVDGTLTIADAGLTVNGDLKIQADNVNAVSGPPSNVMLTAARLLYDVTTADDEIVEITLTGTQELDVLTDSDVRIQLNSAAMISDLNCDGTGISATTVGGATVVLDALGGDVTQNFAQTGLFDSRIVTTNLLLLGNSDLHLCDPQNDIDVIAATTSGTLSFSDIDDLIVGTVSEVLPVIPPNVIGITAFGTDVQLVAGTTLTLDDAITTSGIGDVRLQANGLITQDVDGIITANELAVRQLNAAGGAIELGFNNAVDGVATFNASSDLTVFKSTQALTVSSLASVTDCGVTFGQTDGAISANGDIQIQSDSDLAIDFAIDAGSADVRLIASGNITQDVDGLITANELGVQQTDIVAGNVVLCFANNIDEVAVQNDAVNGAVSIRSTRDLTVGTVTALASGASSFANTVGITTLNGDAFVVSDLTLTLDDVINVGTADVRLQASGAIVQDVDGLITANEVGVRQLSATSGAIELGFENSVDEIATFNASADITTFQSVRALTVGSVSTVTDCGTTFTLTDGSSSANGDILIESESSLFVDFAIDAGTADVRLIADGDITQDADGIITANELGARQQSVLGGNIVLCFANNVDEVAAFNADDAGTISLRSTRNVIVGNVGPQTSADASFANTLGVVSTNGDIFVVSDLQLTLDHIVDAGTADVRLQATGTISQDLDGLITANELGVRQLSAAGGEIELGFDNAVDEVATFNASADVTRFLSVRALTVGSVTAVTDCGTTFVITNGATSADGDILIASESDLTVDFVVDPGAGNVLLEARGTGSAILNTDVISDGGHISVVAADSIISEDDVTTNGTGTITMLAQAGSITLNDADLDGHGVTTADGDVILDAATDVTLNAQITSTNGDIAVVAANNVTQNVDISTTADVLVDAGTNVNMAATATTTADNILMMAGNDLNISRLVGTTTVALDAGNDITDTNATANNVTAPALRMVAGGMIGAPDIANGTPATNVNAIDTAVDTLAAQSATGTYILEADAVTIDNVAAVTVTADTQQVEFNSTLTATQRTATLATLEDLETTANGPIKLVTTMGTITVNEGGDLDGHGVNANGSGDILLEAGGAGSDVLLTTDVISGTGHITIVAADSITSDDDIMTSGTGTVTMLALAGSIVLSDTDANDHGIITVDGDVIVDAATTVTLDSRITSTTGDIAVVAGTDVNQNANITTGGDVLITAGGSVNVNAATTTTADNILITSAIDLNVASLVATTTVSLDAGNNIIDANGAANNITAPSLRMIAGDMIGDADAANGTPAVNVRAIDTNVDTLAARSANGIYVLEADAVTIDNVGAVSVTVDTQRVEFNSTVTPTQSTDTLSALSDLETTANGPIKLVTSDGTITVNEGGDLDGHGVNANGTGDILLGARGAASDVLLNTDVLSVSGHISIVAANSIISEDDVTTGGTGTITLLAQAGSITLNDADANDHGITTANGDVIVEAATDVVINSQISSTTGDIAVVATNNVNQNANITTGGDVLATAGVDINMAAATTPSVTTSAANILMTAGNDLNIAQLVAVNQVSLDAGNNIVDSNFATNTVTPTVNVTAQSLRMVAGNLIGAPDAANGTPAVNVNAIDTAVDRLAARSANGTYIHEADAVTIGNVAALTITVDTQRVEFNSTVTSTQQTEMLSALQDLETTTNGPIKLVSNDGTITVTEGGDADGTGVTSNGNGEILLEARGAGSDVLLNTDVASDTGHITIVAANSIVAADDVTTGGTGTVTMLAQVGSITLNDADANDHGITTLNGDIIVDAATDITANARITSTTGDIAVVAGNDFNQNTNITTGGDVLVTAGNNVNMAAATTTSASNVLMTSGTDLNIAALVGTTTVSLESGNNIVDANAALNNVTAPALRMVAGGIIGAPDAGNGTPAANINAIDTTIDTLAARSVSGTYILETDGVTIDNVAALTVAVDSQRVEFNSTATSTTRTSTLTTLDDLASTDNGPIKLVTTTGDIIVNDGTDGDGHGISANGTGDVLLDARGTGSIILATDVLSGTGHITILATAAITSADDIATAGNGSVTMQAQAITLNDSDANGHGITTTNGDVIVDAATDVTLNAQITSTTGDIAIIATNTVNQNANITTTGDVLVTAGINVNMVTATTTGTNILMTATDLNIDQLVATDVVALEATNMIADANGAANNVTSSSLRMVAGDTIGTLADPIDTQIETLAAQAPNAIFITEADDVTIDKIDTLTVNVDTETVNFNSTTSASAQMGTLGELEDLETTNANAMIRLEAAAGTVTINDGDDADSHGVSAAGSNSDIRIDADNLVINADVVIEDGVTNEVTNQLLVDIATPDAHGSTFSITDANGDTVVFEFEVPGSTPTTTGNVKIVLTQFDEIFVAQAVVNAVNATAATNAAFDATASVGGSTVTVANSSVIALNQVDSKNPLIVETISLSATTDITISDGVKISTDDDLTVGNSFDSTNDAIRITAGNSVEFANTVEMRTDGGVANRFVNRPLQNTVGTAFFDFSPAFVRLAGSELAFDASIDNQNIPDGTQAQYQLFLNGFDILIGNRGEENLRIDIDWRDPNSAEVIDTSGAPAGLNDNNAVTSQRYQTFFIDQGNGVQTIAHVYTSGANDSDAVTFITNNVSEFLIDFAVSHHDSIQVTGPEVTQPSGNTQPVDNGVISTSDDRGTGLNPLLTDLNNVGDGTTDEDLDNLDLNFENGLTLFTVPAIFIQTDLNETPERDVISVRQSDERIYNTVIPAVFTDDVYVEKQFTSTESTEDYYQLRRRLPGSDELTILIPRLDESEGDQLNTAEEILELLKLKDLDEGENAKAVKPLQDGTGYELWFITEKDRGYKIERPVFEFEVTRGQPEAGAEELEQQAVEQLRLVPIEAADDESDATDAVGKDKTDLDRAGDDATNDATGPDTNELQTPTPTEADVSSNANTENTISGEPTNEATAATAVVTLGALTRRRLTRKSVSATLSERLRGRLEATLR